MVWEYKIVIGDRAKVEADINALGADGWEAVSISASAAACTVLLRKSVA